jgi:hypothetical protein
MDSLPSYGRGQVEFHHHDMHQFGEGHFACDQPLQKAVEAYHFDEFHQELNTYFLQRFDLHRIFDIDPKDHKECNIRVLPSNETLPSIWAWTAVATYKGQDVVRNKHADVWIFQAPGISLEVGMDTKDNTRPFFYARDSAQGRVVFTFDTWDARQPAPELFEVPHVCQK